MKLQGIHHAAIAVHDMEKMKRFYTDILGFTSHPHKGNWLDSGDGSFSLHLMPSDKAQAPVDPSRHVALQVPSLNACVAWLLEKYLRPYQLSIEGYVTWLTENQGPLDAGIGTVFIEDPEGNTLEFVERHRGIFAEYDDGLPD